MKVEVRQSGHLIQDDPVGSSFSTAALRDDLEPMRRVSGEMGVEGEVEGVGACFRAAL